MSGIIHLLPDSLANQIAAGEVIQRPASVVKELLENSIDAKATQVKLILKDSGKSLIQVVDDGIGMSQVDARMCFERHATSKIEKTDDLFHIKSFGFRGEALASIAAIAHIELKTKRTKDEMGTHLVVEGSKVRKQEPVQTQNGTSFSVRNLFFNVPARRKFLKSDPVELKHILEEFARVAIPNPDIFFSVHHNGNELYHFPPSNLRQRIVSYFGKNTNDQIVPVSETTDFISVSGFVGKPGLNKKSRGDQFLFVNRRFIKSNYLNHAIKLAYENIIPKDHFPFYVLLLEIDPAMIDVNIHPTKQEIKFENERLIYNYIKVAVKHALGKYSITPSIDFESNQKELTEPTFYSGGHQENISRAGTSLSQKGKGGEKEKWLEFYESLSNSSEASGEEAITLSSDWTNEDKSDTNKKVNCFQIHESYIISPIKSGWMVIDQSAAHERILYERHLEAIQNMRPMSQTSLFPETYKASPRNAKLLENLLPDIQLIGFNIEKVGESTFIINGQPALDNEISTSKFLESFIDTFYHNQDLQIDIHENLARSLATQLKIRKGKTLSDAEMQELIDKLFACETPYATPGGKKCFVTFGLDELEKRFKK